MPARSPEQRLQRVLALARIDALSLVAVAAPAALASLLFRDWFGAAVGAGVALCGALEWRGRHHLRRRRLGGLAWMATAQLCCLALLLLYAWNLAHQAPRTDLVAHLPSFTRAQLDELFPDPAALPELLLGIQRLTAAAIALAAVLYQGGMAFYYLRARPVARIVFAEPPLLADLPPAAG
jgi:hypothetical protein